MPIVKNVIAKKDVTINTTQESVTLSRGSVGLVRFNNEQEFENLRALGNFDTYGGPPPKVIDLSKPKAAQVNIPEVVQPVVNTPVVENTTEEITETASTSKECPKCGTVMLLIEDDSEPNVIKSVNMCPNCNYEEAVSEKVLDSGKRIRSKKQGNK